MDTRIERIYAAAEYIKNRIGERKPVAGIVLGSGLGKLADKIENPIIVPYKEIPHFPASTAVGHKGNFIAGEIGGKFVVAMQGRFHYYEGYTAPEIAGILRRNPNTVYTHLFRAKEMLREMLGGMEDGI